MATPNYDWRCFICNALVPAKRSTCTQCGCPPELSPQMIELLQAQWQQMGQNSPIPEARLRQIVSPAFSGLQLLAVAASFLGTLTICVVLSGIVGMLLIHPHFGMLPISAASGTARAINVALLLTSLAVALLVGFGVARRINRRLQGQSRDAMF